MRRPGGSSRRNGCGSGGLHRRRPAPSGSSTSASASSSSSSSSSSSADGADLPRGVGERAVHFASLTEGLGRPWDFARAAAELAAVLEGGTYARAGKAGRAALEGAAFLAVGALPSGRASADAALASVLRAAERALPAVRRKALARAAREAAVERSRRPPPQPPIPKAEDLPQDVLSVVFGFLNPRDGAAAAAACSHWRRTAAEDAPRRAAADAAAFLPPGRLAREVSARPGPLDWADLARRCPLAVAAMGHRRTVGIPATAAGARVWSHALHWRTDAAHAPRPRRCYPRRTMPAPADPGEVVAWLDADHPDTSLHAWDLAVPPHAHDALRRAWVQEGWGRGDGGGGAGGGGQGEQGGEGGLRLWAG